MVTCVSRIAIYMQKQGYEAKKRGVGGQKAGLANSDGVNVSHSTRLVGEAGEVDINTADEKVEILRSSLSMYDPNNVYNMDELGLIYKAIPQYSYLIESEVDM